MGIHEEMVRAIRQRHQLSSIHLFETNSCWRAFGSRGDPKKFEESVASGEGVTIAAALDDLNQRLVDGPIKGRARQAERKNNGTTERL